MAEQFIEEMALKQQPLINGFKQQVFHHHPAPDNELRELSNLFVRRTFPRNQILVNTGDKWTNVFYVQKGLLRLFYTDEKGREFNKGFFWEKQFVWPVAPSAREKESLFTIAALEQLVVWVCPFAIFHAWLIQHGYWEKFALPYTELFAEQKFSREYEFLMLSATERFCRFCQEHPELVNRIPDYHIASYIGVTNVSLSRIKNSSDC